jgi:hypothetical protein
VSTYVQTLVKFLLLFINYAETEVDFIRLLEVGLHAHDLRKRLFGVLEGAIAVIEDTYPVPKLGFLNIISFVGTRQLLGTEIPLGQTDDKALAGKQSKPAVNRPSSSSNGLERSDHVHQARDTFTYQDYPRHRHWQDPPSG